MQEDARLARGRGLIRLPVSLLAAGLLLLTAGAVSAQEEDAETQRQINELRERLERTEQRLEATAEMLEERDAGAGARDTTIGGYGELHYNNREFDDGDRKRELDFHRFVLFFGHEFTDRIRFHSEVEIEHALVGGENECELVGGNIECDAEAPGEIELEQAYVEFDLTDRTSAKGGLFLIPVGILNETHEPPTFYGVERNQVEHDIIPATWWAGGAAATGRLGGGLSYDLAVHEGLNVNTTSYSIRSGRQKTAEAQADDLAVTGRLKYTGVPGLELATTVQRQNDVTQNNDPSADAATLYEGHAVWQRGPFGLRALYATWDLDGPGPASIGADEQTGWYVEPSFRITRQWGVFARHSLWDNRAGDAADSEFERDSVGVNFWPHPDVVIKADYQQQDGFNDATSWDGFNLGIGYQF